MSFQHFCFTGRNVFLKPRVFSIKAKRMLASVANYEYKTLKVSSPSNHILHVELNRPDKRNAMNQQFFLDIRRCFEQIKDDSSARAIILSGSGKLFTSGLDLMSYMPHLMPKTDEDVGRRAFQLRTMVSEMQNSFTAIEKCHQPVIGVVHSGCVGGGIDLICACDIRLCTKDSWFTIKEVDLGLAADLGTLQRLPKVIGNQSLVRELAFTARKMFADEALSCGLVSRLYDDKETMLLHATELAIEIASKSPVAVATTKHQLNYARDHTVEEGLDYIKIALQLKLNLENLTDLIPEGEDFRWYVKVKCSNCQEESKAFVYLSLLESSPLKGGRGQASLVSKCKLCSRENSIDILKDTITSYNLEDSNAFKTIVQFDCRGMEPNEFSARTGWVAKGAETSTKFNVDLTEGDWCDFDEKAGQSVGVYEIESRFIKA